jgi:hypothetical protein
LRNPHLRGEMWGTRQFLAERAKIRGFFALLRMTNYGDGMLWRPDRSLWLIRGGLKRLQKKSRRSQKAYLSG